MGFKIENKEFSNEHIVASEQPKLKEAIELEGVLTIKQRHFHTQEDVVNILLNNENAGQATEIRLDGVTFYLEAAQTFPVLCHHLKVLELKDCSGVDALLESLSEVPLEKLSIVQEHRVSPINPSSFVEFLTSHPSLEAFMLYGYYLIDEKYIPLAEALCACKNLKELSLDKCTFSGSTAASFAFAIACHPSLEKLSLSKLDNCLGGTWMDWCPMLGSPTIKALDLSGCDSTGLMQIFGGYSTGLEDINLSNCNLREVDPIFMLLLENDSIKKINLSNNIFSCLEGPDLINNMMGMQRPLTVVFHGKEGCFVGNNNTFTEMRRDLIESQLVLEFQPGCNPFENNNHTFLVNSRKRELEKDDNDHNEHWLFSKTQKLVGDNDISYKLDDEQFMLPDPLLRVAQVDSRQMPIQRLVIDEEKKLISVSPGSTLKEVQEFFDYFGTDPRSDYVGLKLTGHIPKDPEVFEGFVNGLEQAKWIEELEITDLDDDHLLFEALSRPLLQGKLKKLTVTPPKYTQKNSLGQLSHFLLENRVLESLKINHVLFLKNINVELSLLAHGIRSCSKLTSLSFENCSFTKSGVTEFCGILKDTNLKELSLRDVTQEKSLIIQLDSKLEDWADLLALPSLVVLDLCNNKVGDGAIRECLLGKNSATNLKELHLGGCVLENATVIRELCVTYPYLNTLFLGDNHLMLTSLVSAIEGIQNDFYNEVLENGANRFLKLVFEGTESYWLDQKQLHPTLKSLAEPGFKKLTLEFSQSNPLLKYQESANEFKANELFMESLSSASFYEPLPRILALPRINTINPGVLTPSRAMGDLEFAFDNFDLDNRMLNFETLQAEKFGRSDNFRGDNIRMVELPSEDSQKTAFLKSVLDSGFKLHEVKSDGTCLFHSAALALQIQNQQSENIINTQDGFDLRNQTIDYMRNNSADFSSFFAMESDLDMLLNSGLLSEDYTQQELASLLSMDELMTELRSTYGETFEKHLELMADTMKHADEPEIVALSRMLQMKIVVFDRKYVKQDGNGRLSGMPTYGNEFDHELHLLREGLHFDLLLPDNDQIMD